MKKSKDKITAKTKMSEVLEKNADAVEVLLESGMMCFGCPMSAGETLEQGCSSHGMSKKEINELVEKLNKK